MKAIEASRIGYEDDLERLEGSFKTETISGVNLYEYILLRDITNECIEQYFRYGDLIGLPEELQSTIVTHKGYFYTLARVPVIDGTRGKVEINNRARLGAGRELDAEDGWLNYIVYMDADDSLCIEWALVRSKSIEVIELAEQYTCALSNQEHVTWLEKLLKRKTGIEFRGDEEP